MTDILLAKTRILLDEAWSNAEANTNAETKIESMAKVMSEMMGFEYSEEMDEMTSAELNQYLEAIAQLIEAKAKDKDDAAKIVVPSA